MDRAGAAGRGLEESLARIVMVGCFRLVLAALVALSHLMPNYGIDLPNINFGAAAVVCFYFISGYLMFLSFGRFREHATAPGRAFYVDRLIRLYPSYFLAYAAASLWVFVALGVNIFASWEWISEVLIIPANYTLLELPLPPAAAANPPTWSLGAEFQFYLILPLVMLLTRRARAALLIIVLAAQIAIMAVPGPMSDHAPWCQAISANFCYFPVSDLLGYRWLPLAAAPFLLGAALAEHGGDRWLPWPLWTTATVYGCVLVLAEMNIVFRNPSTLEVTSATAVLIPIAYVVLRKFNGRGRWDRILGNLAYPLFLDHILCISMTNWTATTGLRAAVTFIVLALIISSAIAMLQASVDRLRYRQRGFGALARSRTVEPSEQSAAAVTA
jgi:peptidoglycan/LPS O-acetylase OafA/YrhL